jgi:hypothetical protein
MERHKKLYKMNTNNHYDMGRVSAVDTDDHHGGEHVGGY